MLIELWERLRGYDKWVRTEARIESSEVQKTSHVSRYGNVYYTYGSGDELVWTDLDGNRQSATFEVDDQSPLYQFVGGETVSICYNPRKPDEFYYRDLLRDRVRVAFRTALVVLIFLALLGLRVINQRIWTPLPK